MKFHLCTKHRFDLQANCATIGKTAWEGNAMKNEFTAIIERDGDWYIATCLEIPGANGQGRTPEEVRQSLAEAIALILEDRREDALRGLPEDACRETITVG